MIADAALPGKQILLVDDDELFREATAAILRSAGYTVQAAADHRLALEILESDERIDLLLTDIVMPDRVNGMALSKWPGCDGGTSASSTSAVMIFPDLSARPRVRFFANQ
jgi:CheY-like chemotaxis protein